MDQHKVKVKHLISVRVQNDGLANRLLENMYLKDIKYTNTINWILILYDTVGKKKLRIFSFFDQLKQNHHRKNIFC
jgi:hypothetical protein